MSAILNVAKIFSKFNVNPQVKQETLLKTLTTLPNVNYEFIFDRLNTLSDQVTGEKGNYKLELSLEKDYVKVICIDPILHEQNSSKGILDIEFQFYLNRLEVAFAIVLNRANNEYTNMFSMNYNDSYTQFANVITPLMTLNQENKMQLVDKLKVQYTQGDAIYGIINESVWKKSVKHYFQICLEQYDITTLYHQVTNFSDIDYVKDKYLIHKSLLAITKDKVYEHFYLLIGNLFDFHYSFDDVHDINGNAQPDYIKIR